MSQLKDLKRAARLALARIEHEMARLREAGHLVPKSLCDQMGDAHVEVNKAQAEVRLERERMRKTKAMTRTIEAQVHERAPLEPGLTNGVHVEPAP